MEENSGGNSTLSGSESREISDNLGLPFDTDDCQPVKVSEVFDYMINTCMDTYGLRRGEIPGEVRGHFEALSGIDGKVLHNGELFIVRTVSSEGGDVTVVEHVELDEFGRPFSFSITKGDIKISRSALAALLVPVGKYSDMFIEDCHIEELIEHRLIMEEEIEIGEARRYSHTRRGFAYVASITSNKSGSAGYFSRW